MERVLCPGIQCTPSGRWFQGLRCVRPTSFHREHHAIGVGTGAVTCPTEETFRSVRERQVRWVNGDVICVTVNTKKELNAIAKKTRRKSEALRQPC